MIRFIRSATVVTSVAALVAALGFSADTASAQTAANAPGAPPAASSAQRSAADPARLKADVEALVAFGTRHTLSSATDPRRGIGAARNWAATRLETIGRTCGGCLTVTRIADRFTGPRAPDGVVVENVLAIQPGTGDPNDVVVIAGHIDSRVTDVMDAASDAPGANDDGSGSALVIEAARILSRERHRATIVYALLSGEEQGLWGGTLLARHAEAQGWRVRAMLNNDIVGGTHGQNGTIVTDRVRVFSEGIRASEDLAAQLRRRGGGGEDDGPSRALARAAIRAGKASGNPLEVFAVRRPDRFRRGGDHLPALEKGFPAIRFTAGIEDYDHQHQNVRTENGIVYGDTVDEMDFPYLAKVTDLNIALAGVLADAPPAPDTVTIDGAVSADTKVSWTPAKDAAGYRVYWRRADAQDWTDSRSVAGTETLLPNVVIDDHFFGVASVAADGSESLVTFAGLPPAQP